MQREAAANSSREGPCSTAGEGLQEGRKHLMQEETDRETKSKMKELKTLNPKP